jgi:hypothetical protein
MIRVTTPYFVAGIDFATREAAPILRWALRYNEAWFIAYCNRKHWRTCHVPH